MCGEAASYDAASFLRSTKERRQCESEGERANKVAAVVNPTSIQSCSSFL